jgi:hypothetical protein
MIPWNKGLTKETSSTINEQSKQKSLWWKTHDTTKTRKKIGLANTKRLTGKKGSTATGWGGGKYTTKRDGYIHIYVPNHPNARKGGGGGGGYVLEHRLVMEKFLGRYLEKYENIHHKNGIKDDNRLENLMLVTHNFHFEEHICPKCSFSYYTK